MRIAKILGTVVLGRSHPAFAGARLRLAEPLSLAELESLAKLESDDQPAGDTPVLWDTGDTVVLWDELGAGVGSLVALSESGEAAQPFRPEIKPVDAYNAAILDKINF